MIIGLFPATGGEKIVPSNSKPKTRAYTGRPVVAAVESSFAELTLEQRRKQAEEPIYLDRL